MAASNNDGSIIRPSTDKSPRRMSKDLRRIKEQRERILEAASEIMARDASGKVTLEGIASEAGISTGTIYYYFKSKGELLYHLHMYSGDLVQDSVYPILTNKTIPPRERLEQAVRAHTMVVCQHWQIWRCFWWDLGLGETPPDLARIVRRRGRGYQKVLADLVTEVCQAEGWTTSEPEATARMIVDLIQSIPRWYKKGGRVTAEELADRVVKCAIDGFFDKPGDHIRRADRGQDRDAP